MAIAQTFRSGTSDIDALDYIETFYAFEPDFFQHNLLRMVDDVVSIIRGSLGLWPTLVEICYFKKGRQGLPQTRVGNRSR